MYEKALEKAYQEAIGRAFKVYVDTPESEQPAAFERYKKAVEKITESYQQAAEYDL